MIKVGRLYKEKLVNLLIENQNQNQGLFFIGVKGLDGLQFNSLRLKLKEIKSQILVCKNSLIKKSVKDIDISGVLESEMAVVYANDDVVTVAKALFKFKEDIDMLMIKGGIIQGEFLNEERVKSLSKLPSRDILIAMLVNCIATPITSLVSGLNQIILKFLWTLNNIKDKKENIK